MKINRPDRHGEGPNYSQDAKKRPLRFYNHASHINVYSFEMGFLKADVSEGKTFLPLKPGQRHLVEKWCKDELHEYMIDDVYPAEAFYGKASRPINVAVTYSRNFRGSWICGMLYFDADTGVCLSDQHAKIISES